MCKLCDKALINNYDYTIKDKYTTIPYCLEYDKGRYFIRTIEDDYDWECIDINYCPICGRKLDHDEEINVDDKYQSLKNSIIKNSSIS